MNIIIATMLNNLINNLIVFPFKKKLSTLKQKVMNKEIYEIFEDCKYLFLLDAGHGSDTPGKRSTVLGEVFYEYKYNRKIQNLLISHLQKNQISYYVISPEEEDIGLEERVRRANEVAVLFGVPCLYISIHGNAAGTEGASGFEVFTSPGQTLSDECATVIYQEAEKTGLFKMRKDLTDGDPDKESPFYVLVHTAMPSILTENGFFSNKVECKNMNSEAFQNAVAKIHLRAIKEIINKNLLDE